MDKTTDCRSIPPLPAIESSVFAALLFLVITRGGLFDPGVTGLNESFEVAQILFEIVADGFQSVCD